MNVRSFVMSVLGCVVASALPTWAQTPSKAAPSVVLEEQKIEFAKGTIKVPQGSRDFTASSSRNEQRDFENKALHVTVSMGLGYSDAESADWAAEKAKSVQGKDVIEKQTLDKTTYFVVLAPGTSEQAAYCYCRLPGGARHLKLLCVGPPAQIALVKEICTSFIPMK
jgi:hypothetical protein